ncbi:gamma-glutamyltransferase [Aurantimonas aggregata]|uniref:Gamma-glutamyltransferase n=1 Tax=Aurantimonas aggregata TaxID=2047720 RepID=A0A6L9MCP6_9HYPH|nr:gamma-glutamyltransferase [Aurantimonas aggregata]NDV85448.1 gamma-glutamyltransferase [Aurantimonas aggregata]
MNAFSRSQTIRKPAIRSKAGIVAAQSRLAAEAGAAVLAEGGDALDAAVATSFALGVLEPWMSGPAGGGAMMIWREAEQKAYCVHYGMRAPAGLDPADYPLSGEGVASDLFPWKAVVDDRNVEGATAVAVPGLVDGIGIAHQRFGRRPWQGLLEPAIALAREGLRIDWYAALILASNTRSLARDADAAALFLEDGMWPPVPGWTALVDRRVPNPAMAETLAVLAERGHREFYDGEIGRRLAADVQAKGGSLSAEDLSAYHATIAEIARTPYRDGGFYLPGNLTAGPTFADVFARLGEGDMTGLDQPDGHSFGAYADAFAGAYQDRLAGMGDNEAPHSPTCTTHFSVVDRDGNMVAMTQTLLSVFGSRVVSPSTGLLLNNGIMWFDPEQGKPNSLGPGKRCLMNVCPVIGETADARFAIGASGGRKILPAVAQLSSFLIDFGLDLDAAFHHPRIDASGGPAVIADEALSPEILAALGQTRRVVTAPRTVYPNSFACPAGVMRRGAQNFGATEIMSPWGDAVAEPSGASDHP